MRKGFLVQNVLLGASALLVAAGYAMPNRDHTGPVLNAAASFVNGTAASASLGDHDGGGDDVRRRGHA